MKKVAAILLLFLIFTGLMLLRKDPLKLETINRMKNQIFSPFSQEPSEDSSGKKETQSAGEEIIQSLKNLEKEKHLIEKKKEKLQKQQEHLLFQKRELEEKAGELLSLKDRVEEYLNEARVKREERIKWTAGIYENMRAEEAASIIEALDSKLAIEILAGMDQRQAAKILEAMEPEKVAELTEKIGKEVPGKK